MEDKNLSKDRPESYPKPDHADQLYKQQDEYIQKQGNRTTEQNPGNDSIQDAEELRSGGQADTIGNP